MTTNAQKRKRACMYDKDKQFDVKITTYENKFVEIPLLLRIQTSEVNLE